MNYAEPLEKTVASFKVSGLSVRTLNRDEFDNSNAKIVKMWERFYSEYVVEQIPDRVPESPFYGVYSNFDSGEDSYYTVTAGVQVTKKPSPLLDFNTVDIQPGCYLVFSNKGMMPQVVIQTWGRIWSYFEDHQELTRTFKTDFEMYTGREEVSIYIGVLKNE